MASRKKKNLVIVESPAKAKTINKYLGSDYEVVASKGHVRDLPKSRLGIDIEKGWIPTYRVLADRKDTIAALKKHVASAGIIYLAPDPDREGEAIAWHLKESLKLDDKRIKRVAFNEITKNAVQKAFANAGDINMDLVAAQEARRFLDRIVGYKLSSLLSQRLAQHLSAGRVQSVAVRLIVDREREIQNFKEEEYWKISALLGKQGTKAKPVIITAETVAARPRPVKGGFGRTDEDKPDSEQPEEKDGGRRAEDREEALDVARSGDRATTRDPLVAARSPDRAAEVPEGAFQAELAEWAGKKFEASSVDAVAPLIQQLGKSDYVVSKVDLKDRQERPPAPFTTSTLQQQASLRLRFPAKKTMMVAQKLYEGVELGGEGSVALITYMRTDSTRISEEALGACRKHIRSQFGDAYLPESPNRYAASKDAQGAHEAIRPTDIAYTPEKVAKFLPSDLLRLYTLIYQRFVACQMKPAVFAVTSIEVTAKPAGSASDGPGLFKAQGRTLKFDGFRKVLVPAGKQEDTLLPAVSESEKLNLLRLEPSRHFTEPPPRYNEASLVKTLEKEGIGRPSTYATIISKIQDRKYVDLKDRRFFATESGMKVTDLLVEHFARIMDLTFTRKMEEELDQVETRKYERNQVLNEFYEPFAQALKVAETKMLADAQKCPLCGAALVERFSRFGKFFGCSRHPECKYIKKKDGAKVEPPKPTEHKCPECGAPMLQRMGRRGPFLGCSRYPECKTTMNFNAEGKPVLASKATEHVCDKCGKPMLLRQGPRGPFLACSGYPKCRNAKDVDAQGNPVKPIETGIVCEKCGSPMHVKRGPRGPFLGCSAIRSAAAPSRYPPI